jgi:hypothetical protein
MNQVHIFPQNFLKIHYNIILSMPRSSEWSLPFRFSNQSTVYIIISPMRATCPAQLILLDLITLEIFGEAYKL